MHTVLIIGCGSIGERHLRCFQATKRANVIACDTNQDILTYTEKTYHVQTRTDWRTSLAKDAPTAVVICTPAPYHVSIAIAALNAGCHVMIEKPVSNSLEGIPELMEIFARRQQKVSVAYVFWVFPFLKKARDYLASGAIGTIRQVVVNSGQPFHLLRKNYSKTYYRDRKMGGGAIQDALTHSVNWIESVVGPTDRLTCDCAHLAVPDVTVEDTVHIAARNGDVLTSYTLNQFQAPNETSIQFNSAEGSVRIELHNQRWGHFRQGASEWTWENCPVPALDSHFSAQANAFLDQIEGMPPRLCSLDAAVQSLRFNLAALASAETGGSVSIPRL